MNEVINNILTRRSSRKFKSEAIPRSDLELIVKAGLYAPSAMGKQTWQFTVITDGAKISRLADAIGTALGREGYDMYRPAAIVITSNAKTAKYGVDDNACAMENMFLAAHSLGIGSVWINQLRDCCDEPSVRGILTEYGLPEDHAAYGIVALGYADEEPKPKDRIGKVKFAD